MQYIAMSKEGNFHIEFPIVTYQKSSIFLYFFAFNGSEKIRVSLSMQLNLLAFLLAHNASLVSLMGIFVRSNKSQWINLDESERENFTQGPFMQVHAFFVHFLKGKLLFVCMSFCLTVYLSVA